MLETFKLRIAKHRIGAGIGGLLTPILFLVLANAALGQNADETPPRGFVARSQWHRPQRMDGPRRRQWTLEGRRRLN